MSKACKTALGLGLIILLASPALAQNQPRQGRGGQGGRGGGFGGGFGGFGYAGLLQNEGVQKELKLDKAEIEKVSAAAKKVNDAHMEDYTKLRELDAQERFPKMREIEAAKNTEVLAAVHDILKPDQLKRLKQIELQQRRAMAFADADVQKSLKLSNDQIEKIKTINDDARAEMQSLRGGAGGGGAGGGGAGGGQGMREKFQAMQKETATKIENVLTDEQKKTWKDMVGEPFQIQMQRPQRPQRGSANG
jgi:hypothetical protein